MADTSSSHDTEASAVQTSHASDAGTDDSPLQRKMKENNAKITDFAVEYYSLLTAEPPFELNNDVPTTPEPNDNFGNKLTTIGKNNDDWNNMNTSADEYMEMATSANGNITIATHANLKSPHSAFIASHRRDQPNKTNVTTATTMHDTPLTGTKTANRHPKVLDTLGAGSTNG